MATQGNQRSKRPIAAAEKEYFNSGAWKCENSPTGAHWWNCNRDPAVCTICGKVKGGTSA